VAEVSLAWANAAYEQQARVAVSRKGRMFMRRLQRNG